MAIRVASAAKTFRNIFRKPGEGAGATSRRKICAGLMARIASKGGQVKSSVTRHAMAMPCRAGQASQVDRGSIWKYRAIIPGNAADTATPKVTPTMPPLKPSIRVCAV